MKKAIIKYIKAKTKAITPCVHNWKNLSKRSVTSAMNPNYDWDEWTFLCSKCGNVNKVNNRQ